MAKNIKKTPADKVTFVAPAGGVVSGQGVVIGALFLVALFDAAAGEQCEGLRTGIVELSKLTNAGSGGAPGAKAYWNTAGSKVTAASAGGVLIGCFDPEEAAVADGTDKATILLNGTVA
jgi:predicted RecA/RadA family phage recombinase